MQPQCQDDYIQSLYEFLKMKNELFKRIARASIKVSLLLSDKDASLPILDYILYNTPAVPGALYHQYLELVNKQRRNMKRCL